MRDSKHEAFLARARTNQRNSRARTKERLRELQRKVHTYELQGINATAEMQRVARKVRDENRRLRKLLIHHGIDNNAIRDYLSSETDIPPETPWSSTSSLRNAQYDQSEMPTTTSAPQNDLSIPESPFRDSLTHTQQHQLACALLTTIPNQDQPLYAVTEAYCTILGPLFGLHSNQEFESQGVVQCSGSEQSISSWLNKQEAGEAQGRC